jgi:hypothetical protein
MRLALAGCAAILLAAAPAGAQTALPSTASIPAPALQGAAKPAPKAKPKPAANASAARTAKAGRPAQADGRKWEDLQMPAPKPQPGEAVWPNQSGGIRPTMGSGGGGMAIGF